MFSDTHCHFSYLSNRGIVLESLIQSLKAINTPFIMDIGTKPGDLQERLQNIKATGSIPSFLHFSCGLWPDGQVIANREQAVQLLEKDLRFLLDQENLQYVALGECGIDRYWNGKNAPSKKNKKALNADDGPGTSDLQGEEDLFSMQLDLSQKLNIPVIVHSREGFDATLGCIKNSGWDYGVIHCFSYGIKEAREFLDRGWYISFPGTITYPKKQAKKDAIAALLQFVPRDRLLLETDAPFLAPEPHRGAVNTPLLISHVYEAAAHMLNISVENLALLMFENAQRLFKRR